MLKIDGGERTKLTKATSKTDSLRTTVPKGIVSHFNLNSEDELVWKIEVREGELIVMVKPIKAEKAEAQEKTQKKKPKK